jgi:hypothetical protein
MIRSTAASSKVEYKPMLEVGLLMLAKTFLRVRESEQLHLILLVTRVN